MFIRDQNCERKKVGARLGRGEGKMCNAVPRVLGPLWRGSGVNHALSRPRLEYNGFSFGILPHSHQSHLSAAQEKAWPRFEKFLHQKKKSFLSSICWSILCWILEVDPCRPVAISLMVAFSALMIQSALVSHDIQLSPQLGLLCEAHLVFPFLDPRPEISFKL